MANSGKENDGREVVVARFRRVRDDIEGHTAEAAGIEQRFLGTLTHAPPQALYRYQSTLDRLTDVQANLAEQAAFLRAPGRAGGRLLLGERHFSRAGFAAYLLTRHGVVAAARQDPVEAAAALIDQQTSQCRARSESLISERGLLVSQARELQRHIALSIDLGLIGRDDGVVTDTTACLWFCFEEGVIRRQARVAAEARARSLLSPEHISLAFARLLNAYRERLGERLGPLLQRRRTELYQHAAKERVERLMLGRRPSGAAGGNEPVVVAIAGLRFAYACEQGLEPGKVPPAAVSSYQQRISNASSQVVIGAVQALIARGMLTEEDFGLLRYLTPVRQAFLAVAAGLSGAARGSSIQLLLRN